LRTPATVASAINRSLMKHGADLNSPWSKKMQKIEDLGCRLKATALWADI
jgi:hypothetical protein